MTASPVLHLKFDEGSGAFAKDSSGAGNHGSIAGSATWVAGKKGKALSLNGSTNYVNCGNGSAFNFTSGDFTFAFWIKPTVITGNHNIICRGVTATSGYKIIQVAGAIYLVTWQAAATQNSYTGAILAAGVWQHIAVARTGATVTIYLNGVSQAVTYSSAVINPVTSTANLLIGVYNDLSTEPFSGDIDDVYVFDRALVQGEIQNLMPVRHAPVLHLRFDEGSGAIASDSSGMGNHGAITGATWAAGKYGKALSFNGSTGYVTISSLATTFPSNLFTITVWVNATTLSAWGSYIDKNWTSGWSFGQNSSKLWFLNASNQYWSNTTIPSGWFFAAITYDGTNLTFYLNGIADGTANIGALNTNTNSISLAKNGGGGYFSGLLDEIQLFNRALSPSEIMALYVQTPPKWIVQYNDGTRWVEIPACKLENVNEELNGHEEASFLLLNTEANRALVLNDYPVRIYYNYGLMFEGILKAVGYSMTQLQVTCYNQQYETLQKRKFTGSYTATAANTVLAAITGTGAYSGGQTWGELGTGVEMGYNPLGYKPASQFQMVNVSGSTVTKITLLVKASVSGTKAKIGLYSDSSNAPNTLLGTSNEVTLTNTADYAWIDFTFASPVAVSANAYYWFACMADGDLWLKCTVTDRGYNTYVYNSNVYSNGFSNPYGTLAGGIKTVASAYATLNTVVTSGGVCPTTAVTEKYDNTNAFDAASGLAKTLSKDFWGNQYFNIGVRNNCVLCLPFEDGLGNVVTDVSGYGNHGAVYPAAGNFTFGRTGTGDIEYGGALYTAGRTTVGATSSPVNDKSAQITSGFAGTLTSISVYLTGSAAGRHACVAIYADSANTPAALIAQSTTQEITSDGWKTFTFSQAVAASTKYWLAVLTDSANLLWSFDAGSLLFASAGFGTYPTFSNPSTASVDAVQYNISIYATIMPSAGLANSKMSSKFTAGATGYLSKLSAYVKRSSSGKIRMALYTDSSGPSALVASTQEVTVGTSLGWVDFPFDPAAQPSVVNGTSYWIAVISAADYTVKAQSATGNIDYNADTYSDGFANPFGSPTVTASYELCLYATGYLPLPTWVDGRYGKALSFNGTSSKIQVANATSLNPTTAITIAVWFKQTAFVHTAGLMYKQGQYYLWTRSSSAIYATVYIDGAERTAWGEMNPVLGQWYFFVMTYDSATKTIYTYVNGVQQTYAGGTPVVLSGLGSYTIGTSTNILYLGYNPDWGTWLNGVTDEAMVFNRALSADEVAFLYNASPYGGASTKRRVDRSKVRSAIVVKGVDTQGNKIEGTAGTGSDVQVLTQIEPASTTTLNDLAAQALAQLSQEGVGSAINYPIHSVSGFKPGDTMPVRIPELAVSSNLRIQKIQKNPSYASISFEKSLSLLESLLKQVQSGNIQQVAARAGVTFTRSLSSAAPSNPLAGDLWYKTDTGAYFFYTGAVWSAV